MDVYLLDIFASVGSQFVLNTLAFEGPGSSSVTPFDDAKNLITAWVAANQVPMMSALSDDYLCQGYHCKRVNNTGGPTVVVPSPGVTGTFGHNSVISSAGAMITAPYFDSGATKPQWRSARMFLPGIPDTAVVENLFSTPFNVVVNAFAAALNIPLVVSPGTATYGVWSRKEDTFYACPDIQITGKIGTLRKRLRPFI